MPALLTPSVFVRGLTRVAAICIVTLTLTCSAHAGFELIDPPNITTANINPSNKNIEQTFTGTGLHSLDEFNALQDKYVIDFESANTGNTSAEQFSEGEVQLNTGTSGIDLTATISDTGGGFAVFNTGASASFVSSGDTGVAFSGQSDAWIRFDQNVAALGFVINRAVNGFDIEIDIRDETGTVIETYSAPSIGQNRDLFFGYMNPEGTANVRDVLIRYDPVPTSNNQFNIDDVGFAFVVPEPASLTLLGLAGVTLCGRRRRTHRN